MKKPKTNNKRKAEKSEKEENEAKLKQSIKCIKRKDSYNLSNLERRF